MHPLSDRDIVRQHNCNCSPITSRLSEVGNLVGHIVNNLFFLTVDIMALPIRAISCNRYCNPQGNNLIRHRLVKTMGDVLTLTLRIINPNADIPDTVELDVIQPRQLETLSRISSAYQLIAPLTNKAYEKAYSCSSFADRHVTARLLFLAEFLCGLPLRVADVALGLLATPFALLTCGIFPRLNRVAQLGWASLGAIPGDAIHFISKMISPRLTL